MALAALFGVAESFALMAVNKPPPTRATLATAMILPKALRGLATASSSVLSASTSGARFCAATFWRLGGADALARFVAAAGGSALTDGAGGFTAGRATGFAEGTAAGFIAGTVGFATNASAGFAGGAGGCTEGAAGFTEGAAGFTEGAAGFTDGVATAARAVAFGSAFASRRVIQVGAPSRRRIVSPSISPRA